MEEEASTFKSKSSRFSRTIHRVFSFRSKEKSNGGKFGICTLPPSRSNRSFKIDDDDDADDLNRAVLGRLFAGVSTIKAAYAELQLAQCPFDREAIQASDRAVVDELLAISKLKRNFLLRELDVSPPAMLILAEIQELRSLLRTYEIPTKKLEAESEAKDSELHALRNQLDEVISGKKAMEKRLNAGGCLSVFDNFTIGSLGPTHFVQVLHFALRSVRSFVKVMVKEMELANWDLNEAVESMEPAANFARPCHRIYLFESFVCKSIFEGFNFPNFMLPETEHSAEIQGKAQQHFFEQFKKLKSTEPEQFIVQNPHSSFAKFTRAKYITLVHPKMEYSFFGNLSLRKLVASWRCPADDSGFFGSFAEMCKRVWVLHCLAFSFDEEVSIFQAKRNSRFSEVFMQPVTEDVLCPDGRDGEGDIPVGFTVVPGFKIGRNVVQCRVYLSPAAAPVSR